MRIVHAADLHLDSPLRGLSRLGDDDVATALRQASRRALENLVATVTAVGAQALVLAGDTYDGDWPDYATGRFFAQQMDVLHASGVPVFMVSGNHDAESQITRSLTLPPNVRVLSTSEPETVILDDVGLAVHGQGFATRDVTENLVLAYPPRVNGLVNVGLLHTAVAGAEGHAMYAPCSPDDLAGPAYDYMALGHVHERGVVVEGPHVAAFSGNLQGRHPRESGPKGALVVDLQPGERAELRFEALDVARWARLDVDVSGTESLDDVLGRLDAALRRARDDAEGRLLVVRVTVTGTTGAAHRLADTEHLGEEAAALASRHGVTLEKVRARVAPPAWRGSVDADLLAALAEGGAALEHDTARLRELAKPLDRELGRALLSAGGLDLRDGDTLAALAAQATRQLTAVLSEAGGAGS